MKNNPPAGDTSRGDDDTAWEKSPLGLFSRWPESLRAYFLTICALPHPSAIFWGEELILLRNKAWTESHSAIKGQGQPQREGLSQFLRKTLQAIIDSGLSQELRSGDQFEELATGNHNASVAILSQLHPRGVLVQLIHRSSKETSSSPSGTDWDVIQHKNIQAKNTADEESGKPGDGVPIDEHPFFRRFAELLPSGLAILDREAKAMFVNRKFWDLTTLQIDEQFTSWPQSIHEDDYDRVMEAYRKAFSQQQELRVEFRAKDDPQPWRLLLLTPLGDDKSHHISTRDRGGFICSIVDISSEKAAELTERKAAQLAHERKEQQERFIDMISHEIRNPLSAILHCAEDIGDAIGDGDSTSKAAIEVDIVREALATINLCVSHQKNIVDDVLSFSKLDASLLSLRPTACQPSKSLKTTLGMFQREFRKEKLHFNFDVEPHYDSLPVRSVMADMPRVGQVLINLMTNAIKFTQRGHEKRISCAVSASKTRPTSYPPDVVFFRTENLSKMDATNNKEWGNGEALYIMVAVRDSGIGISSLNQEKLFERFQQATPRTQEKYGGTGLGLNISRKICQLHGGEIGVSSKEGEGSTFGFFFKVRRILNDGSEPIATETDGESEARISEKMQEGIDQATPGSDFGTEPFEWKPTPSRDHASFLDDAENKENVGQSKEANSDSLARPQDSSADPRPTPTDDKGGSSEDTPADSAEPSRQHVLLVEDNQINQRLLTRKLQKKGFKVTTANNGQEAVAKVKDAPSAGNSSTFDIILMDKEMPILDGNAATREIRKLDKPAELPRVPIIGVTANVRKEQQEEMLSSGMDDVISKPYEIEEMITKIRKVTGIDKNSKQPSESQFQPK